MPNWPSEETPQDIEVATLKRAKQKLEDQLTDRDNELRTLKEENGDRKKEVKEAIYRAQHEADQASQAQEALRKKNEAYNNLKIQKDNAETALISSETKVKERDGELKKLTYQLEVTSARSATAANAQVAEEKAALEKRVHKLSMELQQAQLELEKEKESRSSAVLADSTNGKASAASKIARPASRSSNVTAETPRGRFGFNSGIPSAPSTAKSRTSISTSDSQPPSSIRPPSSLSNHQSSIPGTSKLPARRPSVAGSTPSAINTSSTAQQTAKLAQLESSLSSAQDTITYLSTDLANAQSTIQTLETTLSTTQNQFAKKKEELLRIENQLMALERSSKEELEVLRNDAEEAKDYLELAKEETKEVREELSREMEQLVKDAQEEKRELEERANELNLELEGLEAELERRGGEREDLLRELNGAKEQIAELTESLEEKAEECEELENELAFTEETHEAAMDEAKEKREELEAELADLRNLQAEMEKRGGDIEDMEGNREELERLLRVAREESQELRSRLSDAEAAQEQLRATSSERQAELDDLRNQLAAIPPPTSSTNDSTALEARIAILEAEVFKKESEIDSLESQLSDYDDLVAAHDALNAECDALDVKLAKKNEELETVSTKFDQIIKSESDAQESITVLKETVHQLEEKITALTVERDQFAANSSKHADSLTSLESELSHFHSLPVRSHDDSKVQDLEEQVAAEQAKVISQEERIQELETGEWATEEAERASKNRIAILETEITDLKDKMMTERGSSLTAELDLELANKNLEETKEELSAVQGLLDIETRARKELEKTKLELELKVPEESFSSGHIAELERELEEVNAQLDDVRASAEDDSYTHMQEIAELQLRLRGQEYQIEDLQRELSVLDALRHILGETEARLDSLGWDLKAAQSSAKEQAKQAQEKIDHLNKRSEAAEEEGLRLRSELDETRHKLSDAQDALDQSQAELATSATLAPFTPLPSSPLAPSPSPTNLSFGFSPSSDPTILILRLREERDELRQRLDFARTEASFRVESLQKRLELSEQNNAKALSIMEIDLMDKSVALEHECDTNAKVEEALRMAKTEKTRIEDELESATRELKLATGKVDEFEKRLQEADRAREEHEAERESAWALEGELEAATRSAESIREQLDSVNASNTELNSTLHALRSDLREAAAELDRQHARASESASRISQLEEALDAARKEEESRQNGALAEFATLCETLETDASGLRSKIAEQTALINERERSIALLQLNLAVRIAIEDDDDDDEEETERERSIQEEEEEDLFAGDRTIAVDPSSSPDHLADLETRLSEELSTRLFLETRLTQLEAQLLLVTSQYREATISSAKLEEELSVAGRQDEEQQGRLEEAQSALEDLEQRQGSLQTERDDLVETVNSLRQDLLEFETAQTISKEQVTILEISVAEKTSQLDLALERINSLENSLDDLQTTSNSTAESSQAQVQALELQLAEVEERLTRALSDLTASNERAHLATTSLDALQDRFSALSTDHQRLESSYQQQEAALSTATSDRQAEISQLERQLVKAEEYAILHEQAQRRISILEEQLAAAQESLATSNGRDEEQVSSLSTQLESALQDVERLSTLLEQERSTAALAASAADEAVQQEKETNLKARAASERAAMEIQTLRQLGRASQAEAEALTNEVNQLRAQVGQLETHIQAFAQASEEKIKLVRTEQDQHMKEVLDCLQENEDQVVTLNRALVEKNSALVKKESELVEKDTRVEELEHLLMQRMEDMDEADEKLIEALKLQKRYASQIERLKAKITALQRDLVLSKSTPVPLPIPTPTPSTITTTEAPLSNKKRRAPADFDSVSTSTSSSSLTNAPLAPRAIIAKPSTPTTTLLFDKENRHEPKLVPSSSSRTTKKDTMVPLKPEHQQSLPPPRTVLGQVNENGSNVVVKEIKLGVETGAGLGGGGTKLEALKAKLAAQKKRSRAGTGALTAST